MQKSKSCEIAKVAQQTDTLSYDNENTLKVVLMQRPKPSPKTKSNTKGKFIKSKLNSQNSNN